MRYNTMYEKTFRTKFNYLLLLILANWSFCSAETRKCASRKSQFGIVCVCTANYCDYLENPQPTGPNDIVIISSSKAGLRFEVTTGHFGVQEILQIATNQTDATEDQTTPKPSQLLVNRDKTYQKIVGFGGAFTGAVSHVLKQVSAELQDHIYKSFYHKDGIAFNLIRMPIGGCDFDLEPWAYNEYPRNDTHLSNFIKLDARDAQKVEQLKRLKDVAELEKIKIMASAWSSPTWMKSNENWTGFSYLKPEYYQTWADYHLRFIELMAANGMPIWAITTGNEPLNAVIGWLLIRFMSLGWIPGDQAIWLSDNLAPTIKNSTFKNILIFGNDEQRYSYPAWFKAMNVSRAESLNYLDGLAVHWYWDKNFGTEYMDRTHNLMPDKLILNTESCIGDMPFQRPGPKLGSWERAVVYIRAFLENFQHHYNGWIDCNIILDEEGGPNYISHTFDAPIIVNTNNRSEFYKEPIFYALGHFSKFIPEGSVRIDVRVRRNYHLDAVGFKRPDNRIVLVLFNSEFASMNVVLNDSIRGNIVINIPARSVHTIIYN